MDRGRNAMVLGDVRLIHISDNMGTR
jgi:hypothetical protein